MKVLELEGKFIFDQDMTTAWNCSYIIGKKHFFNGSLMGYNMYGVTNSEFPLLGTFDTEEELYEEMDRITNSKDMFYFVRLYV